MTRVTDLRDMDGLPFTPEARLPHPVDLARWTESGLVGIDADAGRFMLTPAGREAAGKEGSE